MRTPVRSGPIRGVHPGSKRVSLMLSGVCPRTCSTRIASRWQLIAGETVSSVVSVVEGEPVIGRAGVGKKVPDAVVTVVASGR